MSSDSELERRFSDNIDSMLAGQAVEADPSMADDMRAALAFAQKMVALRPSPSPQFQAQLRARLLNKLNAETAGRPSWLERIWPRRVGWQVAAALAVLVLAIGIAWSQGLFQTSEPVSPAGPYLSVSATTDKPVYRPGEPVQVQVTLKNATSEPFTVERFPPILSLMQADTKQPVYTFGAGQDARTLAPNESVTFQVVWGQRDDKARMVPSGAYYLELEDLDYRGQTVKLNLTRMVQFDIGREV